MKVKNGKVFGVMPEGIHVHERYIYVSLKTALEHRAEEVHSDSGIRVFLQMYYNVKAGVLFEFRKTPKIIAKRDTFVSFECSDIQSGLNGVIYWSPEVSFHSNETVSVIVKSDPRLTTDLS